MKHEVGAALEKVFDHYDENLEAIYHPKKGAVFFFLCGKEVGSGKTSCEVGQVFSSIVNDPAHRRKLRRPR